MCRFEGHREGEGRIEYTTGINDRIACIAWRWHRWIKGHVDPLRYLESRLVYNRIMKKSD